MLTSVKQYVILNTDKGSMKELVEEIEGKLILEKSKLFWTKLSKKLKAYELKSKPKLFK
jgi:hypothetical protein